MTGDRPTGLKQASELTRLLRGLGQEPLQAERDVEEESEREARMAAHIDVTVAALVERRRASRWLWLGVSAAAAAVLALGGLGYARLGKTGVSIEQEPLAASATGQFRVTPPEAEPTALPPTPASSRAGAGEPTRSMLSSSGAVAAPTPPGSASAEPQSTLAEENLLFKQAAEASRAGDTEGALSRLDRLLTDHPASPLAQTALVRKFRLLAKVGRSAEARQEAARYLTSYPTGFAVNEALALANGSAAPATSQAAPPLEKPRTP